MRKTVIALILPFVIGCSKPSSMPDYKAQLADLRDKCEMFDSEKTQFFLFGMGNRDKYVYKDFKLINVDNGDVVESFDNAVSDSIMPADYSVAIETAEGRVIISEDEEGIWIDDGTRRMLPGKRCKLNLPEFDEFKYGKIMKVLHHELLYNVRDSKIYPNIFVYREPFLRDAMMGLMCLEKTGNASLISDWMLSNDSIYDMQNHEAEADNLGELLYMLSAIPSDSNKILREKLAEEIERQTIEGDGLRYIKGRTDFNYNAEYQTQILKLALARNGMKDSFTDAPSDDAGFYFDLCWFTKGSNHKRRPDLLRADSLTDFRDSPYPYLQWARANYYNDFKAPFNVKDYPLSWEKRASSAHYDGMHVVSDEAVERKICYPHVWMAAEIFLKLYETK